MLRKGSMNPMKRNIQSILLNQDLTTTESDQEIDQLLGIDPQGVEALLNLRNQSSRSSLLEGTYLGLNLSVHALYTSYRDCFQILSNLDEMRIKERKATLTLLDLGAGMGRLAITAALFFPAIKVASIEIVKERLDLAKEALTNINFKGPFNLYHKNLNELNSDKEEDKELKNLFETFDSVFLYLSSNPTFKSLMTKLKKRALKKPFMAIAVESHGDLITTLKKDNPWLTEKDKKLKSNSKRWSEDISFFKSLSLEEMKFIQEEEDYLFQKLLSTLKEVGVLSMSQVPLKWRHLFLNKLSTSKEFELIVEDQDVGSKSSHHYMASTYLLQNALYKHRYQTRFPEREFEPQKIISIVKPSEKWDSWRKARFQNKKISTLGEVRKLIISPKPQVEFSMKGRVALDLLL